MKRHAVIVGLAVLGSGLGFHDQLNAQQQTLGLTLPLASPRAEVAQVVGVTEIDITYHRPAVNEREIWGGLVPYDQIWRSGANENTLISFSTDVTVEGQPLAAGTYGLHSVPGESEWQVVFSSDITAWGSFSYNEENDVLRITVQPEAAPHEERMTFAFDDVTNESATIALRWEKLRLPVKIEVDTETLALDSIREQLKGLSQFFWMGWNQAANYCLTNEVNYEEALEWAESSIQAEERFENLSTKAQLLEKTGDSAQSAEIMVKALDIGNAGQLHQYGRQLITQDQKEEALAVFQRNAEQNSDAWFVGVGLARGYSALGEYDKAAESMKIALEKAPENQKAYIQGLVDRLESQEDIN